MGYDAILIITVFIACIACYELGYRHASKLYSAQQVETKYLVETTLNGVKEILRPEPVPFADLGNEDITNTMTPEYSMAQGFYANVDDMPKRFERKTTMEEQINREV